MARVSAFAYLICRKFSNFRNAPSRPKKNPNLHKFGFQDSVHVQYLENFLFKMAKCSH